MKEKLQDIPKTKKAICHSRTCTIKHLKVNIIKWEIDMRCSAIGMSYRHLQLKAASTDVNFWNKTSSLQYQIIRLLCFKLFGEPRMTHQAQEHPQAMYDEAEKRLLE